jgi:hypothetical protein
MKEHKNEVSMIRIVYVPLLFLKKIVFEIKKYKLRENDE